MNELIYEIQDWMAANTVEGDTSSLEINGYRCPDDGSVRWSVEVKAGTHVVTTAKYVTSKLALTEAANSIRFRAQYGDD